MDHFKDKKICKECKYYVEEEDRSYSILDMLTQRCSYKPPKISDIDYINKKINYEDNPYTLNKDGDCKNYLPMDFKKRLDYIFDRCFGDIEQEREDIVYNAKLKFLDICFPWMYYNLCYNKKRNELIEKLDFGFMTHRIKKGWYYFED